MADDRTFTLIGNFTDNITPALEGINRSLAQTKRAFESFGSKRGGVDTLTKSFGKVISAHVNLKREVKELREEMQKSFSTITEYNKLMGKAIGANIRMQRSTAQAFGQQARDIANANAQLRQRNTLTRAANRARGGYGGGGGGGGGPTRRPPGPPRMSGGYGGGGGSQRMTSRGKNSFGESVMEYSFAQRFASVVEAGIMSGFQTGVALFQTTFKYIGDSFRERIEDQMTDLQAAGGYLSIADRQLKAGKNPFVKTLHESIRFTQSTNKTLAVLANDLPGDTQDYIEVGKRIGDSVAQLVDFDKKGAAEFAKQLQMKPGNKEIYKDQKIKGDGGSEDIKSTITTIIGELTKKTVISGFGGSVGVGGIKGPNSLAGIMERLITDPSMTLGKISKYAATFDPKVLSALKRAMPALDTAGADLLKRAKIVNAMLDEIATPEMISAMRRSVAGILEAYKGAFLNPEVGLLGFGRKLTEGGAATSSMVDEMGNYVKIMKDGKEQIATENLSLFELIGDLMANYGAILKPLVDNLFLIFDPLKELGNVLSKAREASIKVFHQFRNYVAGLEELGKDFKGTTNFRASLLTLTNLFTNMGVFSEGDFSRLRKILVDPDKTMGDLGKVFSEIVNTFFNSDAAKKLGEFFGTLLATIAKEIAQMTGFISKRLGAGKLMDGFTSAFDAAGGGEAVSQIFKDIFEILFDNLKKIFIAAPWQAKVFAGAVLILPVIAQGLGFALASALLLGSKKLAKKIIGLPIAQNGLTKMKASGANALARGKGKGKVTAGQISPFAPTLPNNTRGVGVSNPSFRAMPRVAKANAQFPNVAIPGGVQRGVGGVTGPFKAPKAFTPSPEMAAMEKASRARSAKEAKRSAQLLANEALKRKIAVQELGGVNKVLGKFTKTVGKTTIAFTALDFGLRVFSGENLGTAALGAGGSLAGGAIGAVVGQTLLPFLPGIGAIIGSIVGAFLGDWAATQLPTLFNNFPAKMTAAFTAVTKWFNEAPEKFGIAVGKFVADLGPTWDRLKNAMINLELKFKAWTQRLVIGLQSDWDKFIASVSTGGAIDWNKLGTTLAAKLKEAFSYMRNAMDPVSFGLKLGYDFFIKFMRGFGIGFNSGKPPAMRTDAQTKGLMKYDGKTRAPRPLSNAIASEMRNKPSGSDLVIANSSETVIPAAGGYGVKELMDILVDGFSSIKNQYTSLATGVNDLDKKTSKGFQTVNKTIDTNQNQNQQEFAKINQNFQQLSTRVSSMSMGGMGDMGGLGAGYGSAGGQIAGQLGNFIKQTGGAPGSIHEHPQHGGVKYRHAPGSYHYQGRAIDIGGYANEQAGILRRIAQFNAMYGVKPVELFHAGNDPKGHSDHVHVAYAYGAGNPAFFSNQRDAKSFEDKLIPSNVKSITSNTGELAGLFDGLFGQKPKERKPGQKPTMSELGTETGYKMLQRKKAMEDAMKLLNQSSYISPDRMAGQSGQIASSSGPVSVNAPITIQQLPGQNADQLAAIVARKIGEAIADAQSASLFV